ncbi:MAG TPA: succinate dehydrogenase, hydrophobic membrane anchor protein [Steroidobacteraceae bacterium]|nr:succinate dehydrogenase, hydrophobic membrane anchor protein [Steroidobacteraceae bacterium]
MSLRSPLAVVLGRGAAGEGAAHWWAQRASALALVPLTLWFLLALSRLPLDDFVAVTLWMSDGANSLWLALLVVVLCVHSRLGVQVVIEDYVHGVAAKFTALLLNSAAHLLLAAAGLYALLRVAMRGLA